MTGACRINILGVLFSVLMAVCAVYPCAATPPLHQTCLDSNLVIPYAVRGINPPVTEYSLKKSDGQTYFVFLHGKAVPGYNHSDGTPIIPWRLLERRGETLTYCLIAFGDEVLLMTNLPTKTNPKKKYGMPGSGFQRCSDANEVWDQIDVRLWANRELGDSFIIHLTSQVGDDDFTFLMADDLNWILINTSKSEKFKSCYYSRGPSLSTIDNFQVRPSLIEKLAEFEAKEASSTLAAPPSVNSTEQAGEFRNAAPPTSIFRAGIIRRRASNSSAPFRIKTAGGSRYFFKLINLKTNLEEMAGFIVGGMAFETKVATGVYELRYAAGDTWINETDYFGPETSFSKTLNPLSFVVVSNEARGVEVELILQKDGNLHTRAISKQDF